VYSYELAETKVAAVHDLAEQYEFPLKSSMEEA
jgi:ATP-dependent Clp protease adapter protein ClpS